MKRTKYLALAASLILGATGFAFAQENASSMHSMHHAKAANTMMAGTACPGMQGDVAGTGASQAGKNAGAQPTKTQVQPTDTKNPYWELRDWAYINSNGGGE